MGRMFIPKTWRLHRIVWFLMVFELPFTVANLALFGIASPNLYRTILWSAGGKRGFNSDPSTIVYAYANYRPVQIPLIWSSFNTQYHLYIGVTCMFFYLLKCTLWLLHVFYPILSVILHATFVILWGYGIHIQTSPDTIDPKRMNKGAPWYLTKSCNIVDDKNVRSYCMQAKSAFAISVIMCGIYFIFLLISLYSLIPTSAQRNAHVTKLAAKRAEKAEWASTMSSPQSRQGTIEEQWQHMWELQQLPRTPGIAGDLKSPMTPRICAFGDLKGEAGEYGGGYQGSRMSKAWQGKYGGHGGMALRPAAEMEGEYHEIGEKKSTGYALYGES